MTRINVRVKPRAKHPSVVEVDALHYIVAVSEPPVAGAANDAVIRTLADYLNCAPSRLTLVRGARTHEKVFQI